MPTINQLARSSGVSVAEIAAQLGILQPDPNNLNLELDTFQVITLSDDPRLVYFLKQTDSARLPDG